MSTKRRWTSCGQTRQTLSIHNTITQDNDAATIAPPRKKLKLEESLNTQHDNMNVCFVIEQAYFTFAL